MEKINRNIINDLKHVENNGFEEMAYKIKIRAYDEEKLAEVLKMFFINGYQKGYSVGSTDQKRINAFSRKRRDKALGDALDNWSDFIINNTKLGVTVANDLIYEFREILEYHLDRK